MNSRYFVITQSKNSLIICDVSLKFRTANGSQAGIPNFSLKKKKTGIRKNEPSETISCIHHYISKSKLNTNMSFIMPELHIDFHLYSENLNFCQTLKKGIFYFIEWQKFCGCRKYWLFFSKFPASIWNFKIKME